VDRQEETEMKKKSQDSFVHPVKVPASITSDVLAASLAKMIADESSIDYTKYDILKRIEGTTPDGVPFTIMIAFGTEASGSLSEWADDNEGRGQVEKVRPQ
jgi:hypothetical protein